MMEPLTIAAALIGCAISKVTPYVANSAARASASWLSGGVSQRQSMPQAARSFGQPRPISRLGRAGRPIGLFYTGLAGRVSRHYGSTHYGPTYYGSAHYGPAYYGSAYHGSTHYGRRFFQLSNDLTTLRWSWKEYLLLDEIVKVCPGPEPATVELHAGDIFQRRVLTLCPYPCPYPYPCPCPYPYPYSYPYPYP